MTQDELAGEREETDVSDVTGRPTARSRRTRATAVATTILALATASGAYAGGPLLVATDGSPVGWDTSSPVLYRTDRGGLGTRSQSAAVQVVDTSFAAWAGVQTAAIRYENRGNLDEDVDSGNFGPYLGPFGGASEPIGKNVVVLDADGSIFDLLFGVGTAVAGFASPTFTSDGTTVTPIGIPIPPGSRIVEGVVFLNGKFLDGVSDPGDGNFEVSDEFFSAVFVHEIGHFSGLGHTQIHGLAYGAKTDLPGTTSPVETMFPFLSGAEQASPERDDRAWISALYPAANFQPSTFSIVGRVLDARGYPAAGVNVVARNIADHTDAVSVVSGFDLRGSGKLLLPGLTPGASYTVETQEIDFPFIDGSSVGPFSPPARVEGPPERYNGTRESSDPKIDDPDDFVALTGPAGQVVGGIDLRLNLQRFAVTNRLFDEPGEWSAITDFAFGDFDGDRRQDFVSAQFGFAPGNLLRLHRGYGDGSFAAPETIGRFPGDFAVVAGQFNAGVDDYLDIAAASSTLNRVRIYLGDGQGGFTPPFLALDRSDLPSRAIINLSAGNLNRDAFTDLAVTVYDGDTETYAVSSLLGNATGEFTDVATELDKADAAPHGLDVAIADATGDGVNDIIAVDTRSSPALALLQGDGSGAFVPRRVDLAAVTRDLAGNALAAGDFNRDGRIDVVITNSFPADGSPTVTRSYGDILLGDGTGGFHLSSRFELPEKFPSALVTADLNNDGNLDIAATGAWYARGKPGNKVTIAFGNGAGGVLATESIWGVAPWPRQLSAVDLDNDARVDLIVGTSISNALGLLATVQANFAVLRQRRCGFSPAAAQGSVSFGGFDCAVPNRLSAEGCTTAELIEECRVGPGRGRVVPCAAAVLRRLRSQGLVSTSEAGRLTACVARTAR